MKKFLVLQSRITVLPDIILALSQASCKPLICFFGAFAIDNSSRVYIILFLFLCFAPGLIWSLQLLKNSSISCNCTKISQLLKFFITVALYLADTSKGCFPSPLHEFVLATKIG